MIQLENDVYRTNAFKCGQFMEKCFKRSYKKTKTLTIKPPIKTRLTCFERK